MYINTCEHRYIKALMWKSEDSLGDSVLSSLPVDPEERTQIIRFDRRYLPTKAFCGP